MSDSEHSDDDDLMAYAATAGKAMEDSDEDIFSLQLPESPALSDDAATTSNTLDHQTPVNITTVSSNKTSTHVSKECSSKRPKTKEEQNSLVKKANKRPRKSILTHRKSKKTSKTSDSGDDQDEDGFMYNTCASVDCIHPHNKHKLVDWVQCDDCDDWYHVMCTGLTLKSVQRKSAKFHCGCV